MKERIKFFSFVSSPKSAKVKLYFVEKEASWNFDIYYTYKRNYPYMPFICIVNEIKTRIDADIYTRDDIEFWYSELLCMQL